MLLGFRVSLGGFRVSVSHRLLLIGFKTGAAAAAASAAAAAADRKPSSETKRGPQQTPSGVNSNSNPARLRVLTS